jgi:hypothetical protein
MNCRVCGSEGAFTNNPGQGLCLDCFRKLVNNLTEAIDNAKSADDAAIIYTSGMKELGVENA